jgi:signal transduction histidine kinase
MNTLKIALQVILFLSLFHTTYSQTAEQINEKAEKILTTDPEEAYKYLLQAQKKNRSEQLSEKISMNIAIVKRVKGEYEESIRLSEEVLKKTKSENVKASAYNNLGAAYKRTGKNEKAIKNYIAALSIYDKTNNQKDAAIVQNNIGLLYQEMDDLNQAKKYHESALEYFSSIDDKEGISKSYNMLGIVLANEGDLEGSLTFFRKSHKLELQLNSKIGVSETVSNIGSVYFYLGQMDSALVYVKKSLEIDRQNKDYSNIADGYNTLAEVYMNTNDFSNAKSSLDSAIYYAKKYNYTTAYLNSLESYSYLYEMENKLDLSLDYLRKFHSEKDSISQLSNQNNINELEKKYQTEKKEMALEEEIVKNKNKTLLLLVLIGAILILTIIIALVIQRRKMDKQKATISILQNLETERTRIARDLHDNLGAELTMISSKLDMKAFRTTNEADKKDLTDIREISTNANFVLRETIWSIHKEELTVDELYRKTEEYTTRILGSKEIRIAVVATEKEAVLSPAIALHLFRIIQEAVNNASKYSNCSEVKVLISPSRVEVYDNGSGFDVKNVKAGYGLQNMQQRAKEFNGSVKIESEKGKGTSVIVEF